MFDELENGQEYYFISTNFYVVGFFTEKKNDVIHLSKGHFHYTQSKELVPCDDIVLDINQLIGYAKT